MNRIADYPLGSKFLIIHADDLGMAHSINAATFAAFSERAITSASAMVTCPWFPEVVQYSTANPMSDIGVHLTLTSEWESYKWRPLWNNTPHSGLVDAHGYLHKRVEFIQAEANVLDSEIRAQIRTALEAGMRPSHLDSHMFSVFNESDITWRYIETGNEFQILTLVPDDISREMQLKVVTGGLSFPRVCIHQADPDTAPNDWLEHYTEIVRGLKPGLNQLIVHLGFDDSELKNVTDRRPRYGSAWRQRDLDVVRSVEFKEAIAENGVILIDWRDVRTIITAHPELLVRSRS